MKLSLEERETIIIWDRANDCASITTYDPRLIKKIEKFCKECPNNGRIDYRDEENGGIHAIVPKERVFVNVKPKQKTDQNRKIDFKRKNIGSDRAETD